MKRTSKILFLFIAIFSILFLAGTNEVFAFANHHIAWRKDVNGDEKPDLLFRRYRTATPEEVKEYLKEPATGYLLLEDGSGYYAYSYESVIYPSKWVEPDANGVRKPSAKEYTTIGFSFHKAQEGTYAPVTEGTSVGSMISHKEDGTITPITNTVANSIYYFNNVSSKIVKPNVLATGEIMESLPSLIFELYSNKGAINKVEFGTRWNISTVQPKNRVVYRYAIVQAGRMDAGTLDEEYIYIEDCVMYHDDLLKFREALDASEWNEETDPLFISDIVISAAQYDDGGYELSRTAAEFFSQYKKRGYTREFWPLDVLGTAEDSTRAVLNSFDNVMSIPKKSKRNVYIRHVGIGEHTSLTSEALRSAELLEANNPKLEIRDDFNSDYETIYPTEIWDDHIEVYEGEIEIYQYIRKAANEYTGENNYVAIGYNIAGGYSFDEAYAMLQLEEYLGVMSSEASNVIELDGLIPENESECIIIEFYYTKKPEIVYVNHLYVDVNNKVLPAVKQQIRGNDTAFTGTLFTVPLPSAKQPYYSLDDDETTINRIQERYYRQAGQSILVRTAVSLLDERFSILHLLDGVRYVGYQKYSSYRTLESLYGTKVDPSKDWYKPFDTILGVIVEPGTKQVNFYYYNQDKTEATIPDKFISMNYYFKSTQDNEGDCLKESNDDNINDGNDANDEKILSIPSGVNVKTGLTELSKVMVSAVNLEYIDAKNNKHDVDIKLQYNVGKDKTTINIDNVEYSFSYFRVDELIVDTLQKVTMFDASEKWATTNGSPLFKWTNDKKEFSFGTETPTLEVNGVKPIDTSDYKNTKDWTNYFGAQITDNKGNKSEEDAEKLSISHQFLSQSQMDEVDANGDGKINAKDKTEAEKKENKLANTVENIEEINEYTLRKYEEKKAQYEEAYDKYIEAKNSSEIMAAAIALVQGEKDKATTALNSARAEANNQEAERIKQNNNIATYEQDIVNRKAWISNAQTVTIPNLKSQLSTQESELEGLKEDKAYYEEMADYYAGVASGHYSTYLSNQSAQEPYLDKRADLDTQVKAAENALKKAKEDKLEACRDDKNSTLCSGADSAISAAEAALTAANDRYSDNESIISSYQTAINDAYTKYSNANSTASSYTNSANTASSNITKKDNQIKATKASIKSAEDDIVEWQGDITYRENTLIPNAKTARNTAITKRDQANASIPALTRAESQAQSNLDIELKNINVFKELDVAGRWLILEACELEYNHRKKSAEKALAALEKAERELLAQQRYRTNLLNKYDKYKAQYDIYAEIKSKTEILSDASFFVSKKEKKEIADLMGINITYRARNAHIKINGESLNNGSNAYIENKKVLKLSEALDQRTELKTPNPQFYKTAYNGVGEKVTEEYYEKLAASSINKNVPNGIRTIAAEAKYKTEILIAKKEGLGPITLYKTAINTVEDDVYYSNYLTPRQELTNGTFKLDYDGLITKTSRKVNIYTPIAASATLTSNAYSLVDQSDITDSSVQVIQLGVPFAVKFGNTAKEEIKPYSGLKDTKKYAAGYYIKFDFDVCNVVVGYYNTSSSTTLTKQGWANSSGTVVNNTRTIRNEVIKAGTWIGPITSATGSKITAINAQVYSDVTDDTINAAEETRSYTVRAYAYNAPNLVDIYGNSLALYYGDKYDLLIDMLQYRSVVKPTVKNICTDKKTTNAATDVPSYFADATYELVVLNKLYDFRITDVKDVAWKSVFRKNTNASVNEHTGNLYYSGIRKWIYSNIDLTKTQPRTTAEIGKDPVRTLPIGPYKHTDKDYVKAPKLGYTFSFDMKVTGAFYDKEGKPLTNKYVDIGTRFYYVSKDGKTFLEEGRNGIYLFYKNASGKYVKLEDGATGGYELKFTPNDAYRYMTDKEKISLSKDVVKLGNLRKLRLTHEMATVYQTYDTVNTANNGTIITYYGEYKLPNSTIAVAVDANGKYDINKPLQDGYIGVIFDITAKAGTYGADPEGKNAKNITLSYGAATKTYAEINNNRKEADLLKTIDTANTSQWDYEGYLGFKNFGYQANFTAAQSIRLEKGQWAINNTLYKKIKGTVMLYDLDDRAATDYE